MTKRKQTHRSNRRTFTREFRMEAVRLMVKRREAGASLEQVAADLDVSPDLLREWGKKLGVLTTVRESRAVVTSELSPAEEVRRLRRELEVTRQERDFLKKAVAFFAKESR